MKSHDIPDAPTMATKGSSKKAFEFFIANQGKSFEVTELRTEFGKSIFSNMPLRKYLAEAGFRLRQLTKDGVTKMWIEKVVKA